MHDIIRNKSPLRISFILPSVGRDEQLRQCIASIERAYCRAKGIDLEILVVFQGVTENKINLEHPELVHSYYIKDKGLSLARNFAIKKCRGEYIVSLDDDAAIKEDFLEVLPGIISNFGASAYCGKIIDPATNLSYSECFLDNQVKSLNRFEFTYFMGSAHILKKSAIEKIGLYDESFGAGAKYPGAEDSDVFFRLKQSGGKIIYLPELVFYHPLNSLTPPFKAFNYSYSLGAMLIKQIFLDTRHFFIYLFIITEIALKASFRAFQTLIFPKRMMAKNERFRFGSVFTGILKGAYDYIRCKWNKEKS